MVGCMTLLIRPIRPEDKELLVAGLGALSERSVYERFLGPKAKFSSNELRYLTEVDFVDHYALVAVDAERPDVIVAVGRWVRDRFDTESAEVAVVVCDERHGQGIGTLLGTELAAAARERGVRRFTATLLAGNVPAHRLLRRLDSQLTVAHEGVLDAAVAELAA